METFGKRPCAEEPKEVCWGARKATRVESHWLGIRNRYPVGEVHVTISSHSQVSSHEN